jgi:5-methylcytosine-specific restriction enzyme A
VKPFARRFYKSKAWRDCRDAYFISQHGLCERCSSPGKIVHHTVYLTPENIQDPMVALNHDLLELHCQDCHNKEHHSNGEDVVAEGLVFNELGELIQAPL